MDKKKYLEQIDNFYKGKTERYDVISLGKPSDKLLSMGIKNDEIIIKQSTLRKCIREPRGSRSAHQLSREILESIPEQLENPVLFIKNTKRGSQIFISDKKDCSGFNILIAIENRRNNSNEYVNEIKSIYGKEHLKEYLQKDEIKQGIMIINRKKAEKLLRVSRLQLPEASADSDYKFIVSDALSSVKKKDEAIYRKSDFAKDLRINGFQPTKGLIRNMENLQRLTGRGCLLQDIHTMYRNMEKLPDQEIREAVEQITDECRQQELERLQLPPPEI